MPWKKCPFGCVVEFTSVQWAGTPKWAGLQCLQCHRESPRDQFKEAEGGAATRIVDAATITSRMYAGNHVDDQIKNRMASILTGLGFLASTRKQRIDTIYQRLIQLMMNAELTTNFATPYLFGYVRSTNAKNMWALPADNTQRGQAYAAERDAGERQIFGPLSRSIRENESIDASQRPIYIVLNVGNLTQGGASPYGNTYVVYRDAVKMRCTFTATDSLQMIRGEARIQDESQRQGVGVRDVATYASLPNALLRVTDNKLKFLCSLAGGPAHTYVDEFIEAQGWGAISLKTDVKAFVISEPDFDELYTMREDNRPSIFPPELVGKTPQERRVILDGLRGDMAAFCTQNGIQLQWLRLGLATRTSVGKRPTSA